MCVNIIKQGIEVCSCGSQELVVYVYVYVYEV